MAESASSDLVALGRVDEAPLPVLYEAAKRALAECASVDECAEWADKAAALASYARQAKDEHLEKYSARVRARAVRRMGEVLRSMPAQAHGGGGRAPAHHEQVSERAQAAERAGLSKAQTKSAVRVAAIPEPDFERAVESDRPPTITELAERGTKKKPQPLVDLQGRAPEDFNRALHLVAALERLADQLDGVEPADFLRGVLPSDKTRVSQTINFLAAWLGELGALIT